MPRQTAISLTLLLACLAATSAMAQDDAGTLELAGGKLAMSAPAKWTRKQPATRIVDFEFGIPAAEGDTSDGRLTVMAAGGGIGANIDRWFGQFTQPDGGNTKQRAKVKKKQVAGQDVHLVDISGTFKDQRGPMAPVVERPKYRMLGAIIETKTAGDVFIKFYGPERTVTENEQAFLTMIDSLKQK